MTDSLEVKCECGHDEKDHNEYCACQVKGCQCGMVGRMTMTCCFCTFKHFDVKTLEDHIRTHIAVKDGIP